MTSIPFGGAVFETMEKVHVHLPGADTPWDYSKGDFREGEEFYFRGIRVNQ